MRGEFHDQPVGQRLDTVFLLLGGVTIAGKRCDWIDLPRFTIGTDMDDFDVIADEGVGCIAIGLILRLVLGPDVSALDLEPTVAMSRWLAPNSAPSKARSISTQRRARRSGG